MILPRLGRWSSTSGHFLVWDRLYWHRRWTMLCRVRVRYLRTQSEMGASDMSTKPPGQAL